MEAPKFTDFVVTSCVPGGQLNPEGLDRTLNMMGAALIKPPGGDYESINGCYIMRVFGDPGFVKFACEHQGYCKIVCEQVNCEDKVSEEVIEAQDSVDYIYAKVADAFAKRVNEIFESEDTLKACFAKHFKNLVFNRTDFWSGILFRELDEIWRQHGPDKLAGLTSHDRFTILDALIDYLDFNLYSQVALNLQNWGLVTYSGDAESELAKIAKRWEKFSATPLSPGAKMVKDAFRPQDIEFNKDLSAVKSLKTITGITPNISFRVSPKGSTPAFADSQNFSTIGIGGDQYVKAAPQHTVWYVAWKPGSTPNILEPDASGGFKTPGIPYSFFSKSGGQILNEVLFSRGVAFAFWSGLEAGTICLPRMNSVMVVTPCGEPEVKKIFGELGFPMLELFKDKRSY